jgi:hypothetical protein
MIRHDRRLDPATVRCDLPLDRDFYLGRLRRFASLSLDPGVCAVQWQARLARHATVSAFHDCVGRGLEAEARRELALALEAAIAA